MESSTKESYTFKFIAQILPKVKASCMHTFPVGVVGRGGGGERGGGGVVPLTNSFSIKKEEIISFTSLSNV